VSYFYNPSIQEAKAGASKVQSKFRLHSETLYQKKKKENLNQLCGQCEDKEEQEEEYEKAVQGECDQSTLYEQMEPSQ
jgi:hypothetical protein